MSLSRLNFLVTSGVLPFNFGMDYDAFKRLYENPAMRGLVGSDPATWTTEEIDATNKMAKEETDLCDWLMALGNDEFYAEVKRLQKEADGNPDQAAVHQPDHQPEPPPLRTVGGEHAG